MAEWSQMSISVSVRPATEEDAEAIVRLVGELGYPADGRTLRERLARLMGRGDCLVMAAQTGTGEVCGWVQANCSEVLESGSRVEIVGLVTAEAMRRRGVGRMLVKCVESWAVGLRAQAVVVRSNVNRVGSHAFYAALGYTTIKTQHVYRKQLT